MSKALRKRVATATHPLMEAAIHGLFRFDDIEQAYARIEEIRQQFILSKQQPASDDARGPAVRLWIRGFSIEKDDEEKGFLGHFAVLSISHTKQGRYNLVAQKELAPLSQHPQKARPQRSHPDWGHPILRGIKKGKNYATLEAADGDLQRLHAEYPATTIPGQAKLHCIIYERIQKNAGPPAVKYTLVVKPTPEGAFIIEAQKNARGIKAPAPTTKEAPKGYFTALVQTKRKRKSTKPAASGTSGTNE